MAELQRFTIVGIDPSVGEFFDDKKKQNVSYDALNFRVQSENKKGIGFIEVVHKMRGDALKNYEKFKHLELPCEADFEFRIEFNGKFPKFELVNVSIV